MLTHNDYGLPICLQQPSDQHEEALFIAREIQRSVAAIAVPGSKRTHADRGLARGGRRWPAIP